MRKIVIGVLIAFSTSSIQAGVGLLVSVPSESHDRIGRRWPVSDIPYAVDSRIHQPLAQAIIDGVAAWNAANLPIRFHPTAAPPAGAYILFKLLGDSPCKDPTATLRGDANWIGYMGNGRHLVCLSPTLATQHTVQHELGHVVGLFHEHGHCDAIQYLQKLETIDKYGKQKKVFFRCSPGDLFSIDRTAEMLTPYDIQSIMHYQVSPENLTAVGVSELARFHLTTLQVGTLPITSPGDKATLSKLYASPSP